MIDLPNVFKLGKGPEHGHVNCSLLLPKNFRPAQPHLSSYDTPLRGVILITWGKCPICTMSNYTDLHLSVGGCIVIYINKQKRENSWHMT